MENKKTGFLNINKNVGPTSHDIIYKMRKITGIKKIGHAGTLDPQACGVLIVAIGREATREINKFVKQDKEYIAVLHLGATSDTYDSEGKIMASKFNIEEINIIKIKMVLEKFIGKQKQIPPMFSAKKVKGKKLYQLARAGIEVKREPSNINIYFIKIIKYKWPMLEIKIKCSTGTYIRSLAHDIGQYLSCGAYLTGLRRTMVGDIDIRDAIDVESLNKDNWEELVFSI